MNWILLAVIGYFVYPLALKPSTVRLAAKLPPAREAAFRYAMRETDPARLADMADAFKAEGLAKESDQLRARAHLRAHPKETLERYAEIVKKALSSDNVQAVEDVAEAFRQDGALSIAELLDEYAAGMTALKNVPPVVVPPHMFETITSSISSSPVASSLAQQTASMSGETVYVPSGVPADTLAALGVMAPSPNQNPVGMTGTGSPMPLPPLPAPPPPQQYAPLSGEDPFTVRPGNMPDNRPLGVPPPNNNFQSNGTPGIGLPGVMPVRPM